MKRIKCAAGKDKEIEYRIKAAKAKPEASGIVTEDLNIHGRERVRACGNAGSFFIVKVVEKK